MHIWEVMATEKHSGQLHGIDSYFSHCQPGGVVVHCLCCSKPGFNMRPGWETTLKDMM
ncbi:hypothetical protein ARMGADRAFT_910961 [Armillaria gallica]|uniref:Uncharacterized protein n=1 Tax=Armillaria gallica TaxID=47427 RepID=A0A2H3E906_ARMGA|nr:hypothetical protein ARMGADRAFT_910961 [Armillaria gallica]